MHIRVNLVDTSLPQQQQLSINQLCLILIQMLHMHLLLQLAQVEALKVTRVKHIKVQGIQKRKSLDGAKCPISKFRDKNYFFHFFRNRMAGAVIENVSSKKLYIGFGLFVCILTAGFVVGGIFSSKPRYPLLIEPSKISIQ